MAQNRIHFGGIDRRTSAYETSGQTEELINMRSRTDRLELVRRKVAIDGITALRVWEHTAEGESIIIALVKEARYNLVAYRNDGGGWKMLCSLLRSSAWDADTCLATMGNILVVSSRTGLWTRAWRYMAGSYTEMDIALPEEAGLSLAYSGQKEFTQRIYTNKEDLDSEKKAAILSAFNTLQEENKDYLFGDTLFAACLRYADGHEGWTFAWSPRIDDNASTGIQLRVRYQYDGTAAWEVAESRNASKLYAIIANGYKVSARIIFPQSSPNTAAEKSYKSFVLYATRGLCPLDLDNIDLVTLEAPVKAYDKDTLYFKEGITPAQLEWNGVNTWWYVRSATATTPLKSHGERGKALTAELLYLVDTLPIDATPKTLSFGGSSLAAGEALDVDAGMVRRHGSMLSYNARLHFYNSRAQRFIGDVSAFAVAKENTDIYIDHAIGTRRLRQKLASYAIAEGFIVVPSATATALHQITTVNGVIYRRTVPLTQSERYNFAWGYNIATPSADPSFDMSATEGKALVYDETDAINVTGRYSPTDFPVENSYVFGGDILGVLPSVQGVSTVQTGESPLAVFTTNGVYALMPGTGSVLYSRITPLSTLHLNGGAVSTPAGVVCATNGGLYLIAGNDTALLSEALTGSPDRTIEDDGGVYGKICKGTLLYDISALLSGEDFRSFIRGARLAFDREENEIIVSRDNRGYSYVFSMATKLWHKIGACLAEQDPASHYAVVGGTVYDMDEERLDDYLVTAHCETRPLRFATTAAHIQRLLLHCSALIDKDSNITLSMWGSDNLRDWRCIISSSKKLGDIDNTEKYVAQIRTNKAARSWKYYKVAFGGTLHSDTDIAYLLADFEPVVRRLG